MSVSPRSHSIRIGQRVRCRADGCTYLVVDFCDRNSLIVAAQNGNEFVVHYETIEP